ncbi:MAG TPA: hypothetical protein VIW67_02050 [Terriglobales bacterium]
MTVLQLDGVNPVTVQVETEREIKLLVEWSSPWEEFRTSIRPAFSKSPRRLAGEARTEIFPYKGMLLSLGLEILILLAIIIIPAKIASMTPYEPPKQAKYDVIYYSADELPRTEDAGGAQTGRSGKAGGREAFHHTQTIRVERGGSLREKVVDAPNLKLPVSNDAVANLLAYKPVAGPPPAEGLKSSFRGPGTLETQVVAPAPSMQQQAMRSAPSLTAPNVVAPAPSMPQQGMRATPSLSASAVVAPAPSMQQQAMRSAPSLNAPSVVAPSPAAPKRELAALQIPGSHVTQVVPPPVSAPERANNLNPKLTLPSQLVVAPAPAQVTRDLSARGPGFGSGELQKQIVPPAVQLPSGTARTGTGIFNGNSDAVVPPPVQMATGSMQQRRGPQGITGGVGVAAPTVQMGAGGMQRRGPQGLNGNANVVAPTVQIASSGMQRSGANGFGGNGLSGNTAVAAPTPSLSGVGSTTGRGQGNRGGGLGGVGDSGDVTAPPKAGGNGNGTGVVVSSKPGSQQGIPSGGGAGALAMSPKGGTEPGLGGSGGGQSIGHGNGPGSGFSGEGSGAGKDGLGRGSDPNAKGGISPYPGPGGTGTGVNGTPAMPGVSVKGGNSNIVTLPSFGGDGAQPNDPSRSSAGKDKRGSGYTIIATSHSGGAFNRYGYLKGDKVYTIYLDTMAGPAVMQMADPLSAAHPSSQDLDAPEPIRTDVPAGILHTRLVIACVMDTSGSLKNFQVLEPGNATMMAKVIAALPHWKFKPAMRSNQPVEVTAILGFNIDTNDRF